MGQLRLLNLFLRCLIPGPSTPFIEYKLHVAENEPESAPLASGMTAACVGPKFVKCFVARDDKTHDQIMEHKHEVAVMKWLTIVSLRLLASKAGGQIINAGNAEAQKKAAPGIVSAILGSKSPQTAIKHANALLGYISFMTKFHKAHPFSFSEEGRLLEQEGSGIGGEAVHQQEAVEAGCPPHG